MSEHITAQAGPEGNLLLDLAFSPMEAAKVLGLGVSPATLDKLSKRGLLRPSRATSRPTCSPTPQLETRLLERIEEVVRRVLAEEHLPRRGFDTNQVAEILNGSPATVMRLRKRNLLNPSVAISKPIYSLAEIERFLSETTEHIR